MSEKLKPCPFCGCEAEIVTIDHFKPTGKLMYSVSCSTINCMGFMTGNDFIKKEYAVTAWNTRHQTTEVSELVLYLTQGLLYLGNIAKEFDGEFARTNEMLGLLTTNGTKHE